MLALWIAIGVVLFVLLLVGTGTTIVRRRRGATLAPERPVTPPPAPPSQPPTTRAPAPETAVAAPEAPAAAEAEAEAEAPAAPVAPGAPPGPPELKDRLGKTRGVLGGYLRSLRARGSVDESTWEELEEALLRADVGVATTTSLLEDLRARVRSGELRGADDVIDALRLDLEASLAAAGDGALHLEDGATNVWLFVGVNGVGKTTTIGKVARRQAAAGHSVLLAAGDTFRAAAGEQLETWAARAGVDVVRGAEGGDPSAVVFDAVQRAAARGNDLVLADTAGRIHTKVNLIEELKKIRRVAERPPGKVTEVLLVLDATTGQNGLAQARQFLDAVAVTGVVLTKLDGSAKGGVVVAIERELGLPVKLVGIGEGPDDLVPFEPAQFVGALFE